MTENSLLTSKLWCFYVKILRNLREQCKIIKKRASHDPFKLWFFQWALQTCFKNCNSLANFLLRIFRPPTNFRLLLEKRTGRKSRKRCQVLFPVYEKNLYSWAALWSYSTDQPLSFHHVALLYFTPCHKGRVWNVIFIISVSRRWERKKRWCEGRGVGGLQTAPGSHGNSIHIIAAALHQAKMPWRARRRTREKREYDGSANEPLDKAESSWTDGAPKIQNSKCLWQNLQTTNDSALWVFISESGLFLWPHTAVLRPKRGKAVGKP